MQALSPSVFPCYATADRAIAEEIAAFLERCGDVRVFIDEGEMRPGETLAEKCREALMADVALVLFSHHSLPPRWPRAEWEAALIHEPAEENVRFGFIRLDDCVPPRVLAPQFRTNQLRALKRWVRHRAAVFLPPPGPRWDGDLEALGIAIADRPGCGTVAHRAIAFEFVREFREDFDAVFRLECGGRSLEALAGDWAVQLGLRLEGDADQNVARLGEFCSNRRFLLILDGQPSPAARRLIFAGRCSTLIAEDGESDPISDDPLRLVQRALRDATAEWTELCAQARLGRRLCTEQGRLAECYELMEQWYAAAGVRGDRAALEESAREMVWILQGWGRTEEADILEHKRATELALQMTLPFLPAPPARGVTGPTG